MNHRFFRSLSLVFVTILLLSLALMACRPQPVVDPPPASETAVSITATPKPTLLPPTATALPPTPTAAALTWPPQVVSSSPAPGETALLDGAVTIRFDQPMDQTAVEAAFSIDPAPADGRFAWPQPDTLVYTPGQPWKRGQTYRVRLDQTAVSQTGVPLADGVELELQTVGYLDISQVMPDGGGNVAVDTAVTVIFNRPTTMAIGAGGTLTASSIATTGCSSPAIFCRRGRINTPTTCRLFYRVSIRCGRPWRSRPFFRRCTAVLPGCCLWLREIKRAAPVHKQSEVKG